MGSGAGEVENARGTLSAIQKPVRCCCSDCADDELADFGVASPLDSVTTPARMRFKMVWKSTGELVIFDDAAKQFRFTGTRAFFAQLQAKVEVLSIGFLGNRMRLKHRGRILQ